MTTISVSVKNKRDANLLYRMLKRLSFVEKVEKIDRVGIHDSEKQYSKIKMILVAQASSDLFLKITDASQWQKELRNSFRC